MQAAAQWMKDSPNDGEQNDLCLRGSTGSNLLFKMNQELPNETETDCSSDEDSYCPVHVQGNTEAK